MFATNVIEMFVVLQSHIADATPKSHICKFSHFHLTELAFWMLQEPKNSVIKQSYLSLSKILTIAYVLISDG